jgi:hypothetical protein
VAFLVALKARGTKRYPDIEEIFLSSSLWMTPPKDIWVYPLFGHPLAGLPASWQRASREQWMEAISKPQITFEGKAQVGEKAEHTW